MQKFVAEFMWTSWTGFFFSFFYHAGFVSPEKSVLPLFLPFLLTSKFLEGKNSNLFLWCHDLWS